MLFEFPLKKARWCKTHFVAQKRTGGEKLKEFLQRLPATDYFGEVGTQLWNMTS